jgi:cytochrome P450
MFMKNDKPVEDFATDFDHTDPQWVNNPFPIWEDLQNRCPVAHTERYGGAWLPTTHETVSAVAYDTENFTSRDIIMSDNRPGPQAPPAPIGVAPPITSDPPFHHDARRLLLPAFSPKAVEKLEPFTREYCQKLIDSIGDRKEFDGAEEYAQNIPVMVIAKMLGFPEEDADIFRVFIRQVLEEVDKPEEERFAGFISLFEYLDKQITEHLESPRDDLTSFLLDAELNGEPLSQAHIVGTIALLLIAGIDTTWSAIGSSLWHLATHPEDRHRLAAEPELMPFAIEEFLRAYAPVTMARLVKNDFDFHGCPMKTDDWVLLPFPAANRDPAVFEDPHTVKLDREENRHAAFGLGIHRCIGSNLARMELTVAVETFIENFGPNFELGDGPVRFSAGQVRGPRQLSLRLTQ